jgi:uncharacterized protein (DUF885 family)
MDSSAEFEQATTEYLAELYEAEPVMATAMGVHDYDDRLPDLNAYAIADRLRRARAYLHRIDRLSLVRMSNDERLDYRLARAETQKEISDLEYLRPLERVPGAYTNIALFGVFLLLIREFADTETRAACALARLRAIPELLLHARENLDNPPRIFTEIALEEAAGGQVFFAETVPAFAAQVPNDALKTELLEAGRDAAENLAGYDRFMQEDLLPRSGGDFALGRELFEYRLRVGHMMEETADDLLEIGRETLEATRKEMVRVGAQVDPARAWQEIVADLKKQHPAASELVEAYRQEMERAREFVVSKRLLDMPEQESLQVVETPVFARATLPYAAYMPAAPFEERQQGMFWVTPVDASLPPERQEAQLQGHSRYGLPVIALHEAYPGHHLQISRANQVPSRFRRHFGHSSLFMEGWALYCEELMHELGFYTDPRVRLMQMKDRLWRACRVIVDVKLHTRQMTVEEAVQFMVEEAKLEEPNARAEVRRYTLTPTQPMSYVMGKRYIQNLRRSLERRQGARFDLRRFHNELLSYGSVPPRLIREAMFTV